ncbi:MalY/PatB family protein [Gephyromycinifex aptenodytis]|uniref:MalY/PatB family protein n=1 Tax=Gephyromycinifex aptenodytis TaxID=2716227 RepID=UPI00144609B1|nr:aminotransferase class I/II-fold pyridoxal phosphate-dependent enzyme [Gephyromycinifex aptenodytis]
MDLTRAFDAITIEQLTAAGSTKWSRDPGTIGAWIAEMDFGTAPVVTEALHEHVRSAAFGYTPTSAKQDLSRAFAGFAERHYGWQIDPARVRPAPDVLAVLGAMIDHFTTGKVIVPTPAYMPFLTLPGVHDREVIQVPLVREGQRWVYDLDALAAAFDDGGELLVLCNPHNPVGRVLEREELLAIADVVESKGGRVFSDEIHAPLVFQGHTHVPYATLDERTAAHTITATSCSKGFNIPGLKCAQAILSNEADAARWAQRCGAVEDGASRPGIVANVTAYDHGEPWLEGVLVYLDRNRRALQELVSTRLPGVGYTPPEGTYLALLDLREAGLGQDPTDRLRSAGVSLTSGLACGEAGAGHARLTFATPLPILTEIVERIARVLP